MEGESTENMIGVPESAPEPPADQKPWLSESRTVRWSLTIAVALLSLFAFMASYWSDAFRACESVNTAISEQASPSETRTESSMQSQTEQSSKTEGSSFEESKSSTVEQSESEVAEEGNWTGSEESNTTTSKESESMTGSGSESEMSEEQATSGSALAVSIGQSKESTTVIDTCKPLGIGQLWPAVLVIGLLLLPDMSEIGIGNLLTLKHRIDTQEKTLVKQEKQQDRLEQLFMLSVSQSQEQRLALYQTFISGGGGTLEIASGQPPRGDDRTVAVNRARVAIAWSALDQLFAPTEAPLSGCRIDLYIHDEYEDVLMAIAGSADPEPAEHWQSGRGATGRAYSTGEYVSATEMTTSDATYDLTEAQQEKFRDLQAVAAMPVTNASGRVIAVLTASSTDPETQLTSEEGFEQLLAIAQESARVLVDLLLWFGDD